MEGIRLRQAVLEDADMVFKWRNDPFVVSRGSLQRTVEWPEHVEWFEQTVLGDRRRMYIIERGNKAIGQVRFDRETDSACSISVYLTTEFIGKGYGISAIRDACAEVFRLWNVERIIARVRRDNAIGAKAFVKAGFEKSKTEQCASDHRAYILQRPPVVPHNRLTFGQEEVDAVSEVVSGGRWSCGPKVGELEAALTAITGRSFAGCVGSGVAALRLALLSLGVSPGDEVIIPAYSCVALTNAVMSTGATPRPVDVIAGEWNLDPECVGSSVTERTKVIIAVHTFGLPARIEQLTEFGVPVIEDCAHALGISVGNRLLGAMGDMAITSFYSTKLIGGGEGGAVLTDSETTAEFVRQWRDYGDQPACASRLNDKMNELEAVLALLQLKRLNNMLDRRRKIAEQYCDTLLSLQETGEVFRLPRQQDERVWYRFAVEMADCAADEVIDGLKTFGVVAEKPVYGWLPSEYRRECKVADRALRSIVSLPLYPTLTAQERERVCHAFTEIVRSAMK